MNSFQDSWICALFDIFNKCNFFEAKQKQKYFTSFNSVIDCQGYRNKRELHNVGLIMHDMTCIMKYQLNCPLVSIAPTPLLCEYYSTPFILNSYQTAVRAISLLKDV